MGRLDSKLDLGPGDGTAIVLESLSVAVGLPAGGDWVARFSAGTVIGGALRAVGGDRHEFTAGVLLAAGLERTSPLQSGLCDWIDWTISVSAVSADTRADEGRTAGDYTAFDLRFGVRAVKRLTPAGLVYAAGRVFGGPVSWQTVGEDLSGSDVHHYQLGAGTGWRFDRIALFGEWAPLGEQGFGVGVGTYW